MYLEVFLTMVVAAAAAAHGADMQASDGVSCVQSIDVNSTDVDTGGPIHFRINLNNSHCSLEDMPLVARLLPCDGGFEFGEIDVNGTELTLCPEEECQILEVGGRNSTFVHAPYKHDIDTTFQKFDNNGLHLAIAKDQRVRSWNLTILACPGPVNCKAERYLGCSVEKVIPNVGNQSVVKIEEPFKVDDCYCFKLEPNSRGTCDLHLGGRIFGHHSGCYPRNSSETQKDISKVIGKGHNWWVVPLGIVAGVAFLVCTSVAAYVTWTYLKKMKFFSDTNRSSTKAAVRGPSPSILILYGRDSVAHLSLVSQLTWRLKNVLHCQVFDIFDDTNLEKLDDPSYWLQDIISKSSVKIVLVLSPLIVECLHALVSGDAKPDAPTGCLSKEQNNKLLLAGIKYLLEQDLMVNYDRVFIVSFGTLDVGSNVGLLVESRRYTLPQHQDLLSGAVMEGCKGGHAGSPSVELI